MSGRFPMDLSTGMTDLCWNLVMFFFLCTVLLARPSLGALASPVPDGEGTGAPAVVRLVGVGTDALARAEVSEVGALGPRAPGEGLVSWLGRTCPRVSAPVVLVCPDDATHRDCQRIAAELLVAAPVCRVQY